MQEGGCVERTTIIYKSHFAPSSDFAIVRESIAGEKTCLVIAGEIALIPTNPIRVLVLLNGSNEGIKPG